MVQIFPRLDGFLTYRIPSDRKDLMLGRHWHWKSFGNKLERISVLVGLSGHICRQVENRDATECLLEHTDDAFLKIIGKQELENCSGNYITEDTVRKKYFRAGQAIN